MRTRLAVSFSLLASVGCTHHLVRLTAASNRTPTPPVGRGARVSGKDCTTMILSIPLGLPSISAAMTKALDTDRNATMLVDVSIREESWWFGVGQLCYVVDGTLAYATPP
jgi:hypothetical protein